MGDAEKGESSTVTPEQNCREAVVTFCESPEIQEAAQDIRFHKNTSKAVRDFFIPPLSAYCIMRSTDRQEQLTRDMHAGSLRMEEQGKRMVRLTWWIMRLTVAVAVMTAAVVLLTIIQISKG